MASQEHCCVISSEYQIERRDKYFEATKSIVEREIRPENTVSFISEVDLTEVERLRGAAQGGCKASYTAFVAKALALALGEFPYANRRVHCRPWLPLAGPRLQRFGRLDVAVAVECDFPGSNSTAFIDILRAGLLAGLAGGTSTEYLSVPPVRAMAALVSALRALTKVSRYRRTERVWSLGVSMVANMGVSFAPVRGFCGAESASCQGETPCHPTPGSDIQRQMIELT